MRGCGSDASPNGGEQELLASVPTTAESRRGETRAQLMFRSVSGHVAWAVLLRAALVSLQTATVANSTTAESRRSSATGSAAHELAVEFQLETCEIRKQVAGPS